jgi:hypothetical protein
MRSACDGPCAVPIGSSCVRLGLIHPTMRPWCDDARAIMLETTTRMDNLDEARIGERQSVTRWPGGRLFFVSTFTSTSAPYRLD